MANESHFQFTEGHTVVGRAQQHQYRVSGFDIPLDLPTLELGHQVATLASRGDLRSSAFIGEFPAEAGTTDPVRSGSIEPESRLGCAAGRLGRLQVCPEGTMANSPRFQPGETGPTPPRLSPEGTTVIQSPITQRVRRRIAHCAMIPINCEVANIRRPVGTSFEFHGLLSPG